MSFHPRCRSSCTRGRSSSNVGKPTRRLSLRRSQQFVWAPLNPIFLLWSDCSENVPAVRIHLAPPSSPSIFRLAGESIEIRACARHLVGTDRDPSFAFVEPVSQQRSSSSNESHLTADPPWISLQQAPGSAEAEEGQVRDTLMCTHQRRISLNINPIGSSRRHMTR